MSNCYTSKNELLNFSKKYFINYDNSTEKKINDSIQRVTKFTHCDTSIIARPDNADLFYLPEESEMLGWIGNDLITKDSVVLDLGSGLGMTSSSYLKSGASRVYGVEIMPKAVECSSKMFSDSTTTPSITFVELDYKKASPEELSKAWGKNAPPTVVLSNPPYTPSDELGVDIKGETANGGVNGLAFYPTVINHAFTLDADLGVVLGSFSSPKKLVDLLGGCGYEIFSITLSALPFGFFSGKNMRHLLALESKGQAVLWRPNNKEPEGYLNIGLAARLCSAAISEQNLCRIKDEFWNLLKVASTSETSALENIKEITTQFQVRILNLT